MRVLCLFSCERGSFLESWSGLSLDSGLGHDHSGFFYVKIDNAFKNR